MIRTPHRAVRLASGALGIAMALGLSTATAHAEPAPGISVTAETTPGSDTVTLRMVSSFAESFSCFHSINLAADSPPSNLFTDNASAVVPANSGSPWYDTEASYTHQLPDGDYAVYWQCMSLSTSFFGNISSSWTPTPTGETVNFSIQTSPATPPIDPVCQGSTCLIPLSVELVDALPWDRVAR